MLELDSFQWRNAVDLGVLVLSIYFVIRWAQTARAFRIVLAIAALYVASAAADLQGLIVTAWVMRVAAMFTVLMLVIVFQRELRVAFLKLYKQVLRGSSASNLSSDYREIADAAFYLAASGLGALLALVREQPTDEVTEGGVELNAEISATLLESIFQKTSPLHDGAVVIEGDRVTRANVVLPLTHSEDVPSVFGTRHRAAMGLAEHCDALVVSVSEETGEVRLFAGGKMRKLGSAKDLEVVLQLELESGRRPASRSLRRALLQNADAKVAALVLGLLIYFVPNQSREMTVRMIDVPVEYVNVPDGLMIDQASERLGVRLRGLRTLIDRLDERSLVARFDLSGAQPGLREIAVNSEQINLPPGISVESVTPRTLYVHITKRAHPAQPAGP